MSGLVFSQKLRGYVGENKQLCILFHSVTVHSAHKLCVQNTEQGEGIKTHSAQLMAALHIRDEPESLDYCVSPCRSLSGKMRTLSLDEDQSSHNSKAQQPWLRGGSPCVTLKGSDAGKKKTKKTKKDQSAPADSSTCSSRRACERLILLCR